jgi:transposase
MVRYREILRLSALGISQRSIAGSVGCSKTTVQEVQRRAEAARLTWPLPAELGDAQIRARLYPPQDRSDPKKAEIDHEWVQRELGRRGVTMTLLWNEYAERAVAAGSSPYMYSAFCHKHQRWLESAPALAMHIEWKPGEWCQVDWCGDTMRVADPDTGELLKVYVFVASLPFSAYIFAEGFYRMDEQAWVDAHVHAFAAFGGTTPLIAPDNLKTGVSRHTVDTLVINEQHRRMLEYYGCAAVPTRVRRPKDKGGVEGAVLIVEREAIAALRDKTFTSLADLNRSLRRQVAKINARPFQRREGGRDSILASQERPCLQPLPPDPYELVTRRVATVGFNYHVSFDGRYYSVPFTHARRQVEVAATRSTVTISCDGERLCQHARSWAAKGAYVTDVSHMPRAHRDYAEWSGERFRRWAAEKGEHVLAVTESILASRQVEQQSFRTCRALLSLGERHGFDLLEEACAKACEISRSPSYKTVKTLVARLAEERPSGQGGDAYVRGADSYKDVGR